MKKIEKMLIAAAILLALSMAGVAGLCIWWQSNQVTVDGLQYKKGSSPLDLRGESISVRHYRNLKEAFPGRKILWDVPFQQGSYPSNTQEITITYLRPEDVKMLEYLPDLTYIDASECFDYEVLNLLKKEYPDCQVKSSVSIAGQVLAPDAARMTITGGEADYESISQSLQNLPQMEEVFFEEPELTAQELLSLREAYPEISFNWKITALGQELTSTMEKLDVSDMEFESIQEIEELTAYLPDLKELTIFNTDLPYEEIAAFRERSRDRFKVVFNVKIRDFDIRTDALWFKPSHFEERVKDYDTRNLRYCEDLIYVDMSGQSVESIDWVRGTPHLQYLVVTNTPLRNLQPLRSAKELKLLDLRGTSPRDLRPLQECTALEDLNLEEVYVSYEPLKQMTWLKTLLITSNKREIPEVENALPHTAVNVYDWQSRTNYQDMWKVLDLRGPSLAK